MTKKAIHLGSSAMIALLAAGCCSSGKVASKPKPPPPTATASAPPEPQPEPTAVATGQIEIVNDQTEIPLRKEEWVLTKRGINEKVVIRTVVKTEDVSKPVDLRREDFVVERIPGDTNQASAENAFQGREVYMPLLREEMVSGKRMILTDAIKISKKSGTETKTINQALRSEDVELVTNPDLSDPKFKDVPRQAPAQGTPPAAESGTAPPADTDPNTFRLAQEELVAGKKSSDGGVYLRKIVRTQQASQPIELRVEEPVIERTKSDPSVVNNVDFGTPREVTLEIFREEAVPQVKTVLTETVRLKKKSEAGQQMVTGTVRKQDIEVVRTETGQGAPAATQTETQNKEQPKDNPEKK